MEDTDASPRPRHRDRADLVRASSVRLSADPVFLVGAARSGTSLLYRVLALHPDATFLSTYNEHFPRLPYLTALNRLTRWFPRRRSISWFGATGDNAYVYGRRRRQIERAFPAPAEAETVYRACGIPELGKPLPAASQEAKDALRTSFRRASKADGGRVVLSKRIANSRRIPLLHEIFPDSRFVEIVRDGRAVARSLGNVNWWEDHEIWWHGGTPADWAAEGRDPWALRAQNWVEEVQATRTGLAAVPADQVLSLSYERLTSHPQEEIRRVVDFLGFDAENAVWLEALSALSFPDKNDRPADRLDDEVLALVENVQADELARYGYSLDSAARHDRSASA